LYHQSTDPEVPVRFYDHDNVPEYEIFESDIGQPVISEKGMWHEYQNISEASLKHRNIVVGKGHFFLCPPNIGGFLLKTRTFGEKLNHNLM